eukprot:3224560-Rhodomonas_salina.1
MASGFGVGVHKHGLGSLGSRVCKPLGVIVVGVKGLLGSTRVCWGLGRTFHDGDDQDDSGDAI